MEGQELPVVGRPTGADPLMGSSTVVDLAVWGSVVADPTQGTAGKGLGSEAVGEGSVSFCGGSSGDDGRGGCGGPSPSRADAAPNARDGSDDED